TNKTKITLAIIEAKENKHTIRAGMQQALDYGNIIDIPFVYSSNGDGFIEHDRTKKDGIIERELTLEEFPTQDELWTRYKEAKGITDEEEKDINHALYFRSE